MLAEMSVRFTLALIVLNLFIQSYCPSAGTGRQDNLKIYWYKIVNVQVVFRIFRGYSLIGKTAILHIVISGSSPDISILVVI